MPNDKRARPSANTNDESWLERAGSAMPFASAARAALDGGDLWLAVGNLMFAAESLARGADERGCELAAVDDEAAAAITAVTRRMDDVTAADARSK